MRKTAKAGGVIKQEPLEREPEENQDPGMCLWGTQDPPFTLPCSSLKKLINTAI